jgi:hypothetical protein
MALKDLLHIKKWAVFSPCSIFFEEGVGNIAVGPAHLSGNKQPHPLLSETPFLQMPE